MHIILRYEMERALIRGDLAVEDVSPGHCRPNGSAGNRNSTCRAALQANKVTHLAQVPKVWNAKMAEYLGVTPENDAQGCLQDVHWSAGREFGRSS